MIEPSQTTDPGHRAHQANRRPASGPAWLGILLVFLGALAALVPTTADFGLTYDEPAYSFSQDMSSQWWEQLAAARSTGDLAALLATDNLADGALYRAKASGRQTFCFFEYATDNTVRERRNLARDLRDALN